MEGSILSKFFSLSSLLLTSAFVRRKGEGEKKKEECA